MLEELGLDLESGEESNESEDDLSNFTSSPTTASKPVKKKPVSKHELVFVSGTLQSALRCVTSVLVFAALVTYFSRTTKTAYWIRHNGNVLCYISWTASSFTINVPVIFSEWTY